MDSSNSHGQPLQSILTLDKSEEPFTAQIATACRILGIRPSKRWNIFLGFGGGLLPYQYNASDPRPEWTLKWLLKKFQSGEVEPGSPCLFFKSWLLFRELVVRIHPAKTAKLLKAHNFTTIVRKTSQWIYVHDEEETLQEVSEDGETTEIFDGEWDLENPVRTSKKRRRDGSEVVASEELCRLPFTGAYLVFLAICTAIGQLVALTTDPKYAQGFSAEHLKSALRTSAEEAAIILGNSLYLTNRILKIPKSVSGQSRSAISEISSHLENTAYKFCVSFIIDLWNARSLTREDTHDNDSNQVFRAHCMLPALQLLHTCREWSSLEKDMGAVTTSLEDLLIKYIILPFRASFVATEQSIQLQDADNRASLTEDLVLVLKAFRFPKSITAIAPGEGAHEGQGEAWDTEANLTVSVLSLLFDVALGYCPPSRPTKSRAEDSWLEELFVQLTNCASTLLTTSSTIIGPKDYPRLVRWMLHKSVWHKLQLSLPRIKVILDQVSGLFTSEPMDLVEWGIINLCMRIDANAFVVPDAANTTDASRLSRPPSKYLSSLLGKLTDGQFENEDDIDYVLRGVAFRLCEAFANARDLSGFIRYWTEQISVLQRRWLKQGRPAMTTRCIWLEERLLQQVVQLVESKLTSNQIDHLLSLAIEELETSHPDVSNGRFFSLASLVALNCLLGGISQEETMKKLGKRVESIFDLLSGSLSDLDQPCIYKWRIWRIKTIIVDRCIELRASPSFECSIQSAISTASKIIDRITVGFSSEEEAAWNEKLFVFRFILRVTEVEDSLEVLRFSSRQKLASSVEKFLDLMDSFCDSISRDHFETEIINAPGYTPSSDFLYTVESMDTLYIVCMTDILTSPLALNCLNAEIHKRLIEQLYWFAVYEERLVRYRQSASINYSWPWMILLHSDCLGGHPASTRHLRNFQVDQYLSMTKIGEGTKVDTASADYIVAFYNVMKMPTDAFSRKQRSAVANGVLRILLYAAISKFSTANDHLTLLTKLIGMPNKSMSLLTNQRETPKDQAAHVSQEVFLIRLALIIDGIEPWSEDKINSIFALRKLTQLVISYLFSTLEQPSSTEYLQVLYDELAELIRFNYRNEKSCTACISAMAEESLHAYANHRDRFPDALRPILQFLDNTRLFHLESILILLREPPSLEEWPEALRLEVPEQRHKCGVLLECLFGYLAQAGKHTSLEEKLLKTFGNNTGISSYLSQVSSHLELGDTAWSSREICGREYLATRLAKVKLLLDVRDSNLLSGISETNRRLHELKSVKERHNLLVSVRKMMLGLGLQSKNQLCFEHDLVQGRILNYSHIYLVGMAVASLKDQEVEELRESIARTFTLLCRCLFEQVEFRDCILAMQCISMLLQKHPRIITQWNIDNLLSAIIVKSSHLENCISVKHSSMLHIGLCRLLGIVFTIHRTKIGGRYHLVILALQSLLRCLFIPYGPNESMSDAPISFTEAHAAAYARLLTILCDPTVSSVTRPKKRSRLELNDETKKAKSIAGQYLPYLIEEFCICQLKGRLAPEMKTALEPGIYAVLAVMSKEVMRTMNAAMDESGRAVWKALYEEFRRIGRPGVL